MGQRIAAVVLVLTCMVGAKQASAEPGARDRPTAASLGLVPHSVYVQVPARPREHLPGQAIAGRGGRTILFLNRGGGSYDGSWWDDSTSNQSSILSFSVQMSPYPYGDRSWGQVLDCMRSVYAPFNIEVTDVDPGTAQHLEVVVSGHPRDIGQQDGVGGIAPMACDVIDNAVAYAFPETYGDDPNGICEAAAQESAHAFGLDHETQCDDLMTYLWCGSKTFTDIDAACGEFRDRACSCGGDTQNSYQYLLSVLGPAPDVDAPPSVSITSPSDGADVEAGFTIEAEATDDHGLASVELYIDGDRVTALAAPPFRFTAPEDLEDGEHQIEVRATDGANPTAADQITVNLVGESTDPGQTDPGQTDPGTDENVEPDPIAPGALGADCDSASACDSNACVAAEGYCTERCNDGVCADGFTCTDTSQGDYCLRAKEEERRSRGCSLGGPVAPAEGSFVIVGLALLGVLWALRRSAPRRRS